MELVVTDVLKFNLGILAYLRKFYQCIIPQKQIFFYCRSNQIALCLKYFHQRNNFSSDTNWFTTSLLVVNVEIRVFSTPY